MKDEQKMAEMKRDYEQIPVPAELKGRLEKTIAQANQEIKKEEKE